MIFQMQENKPKKDTWHNGNIGSETIEKQRKYPV